RWLSTWLSNDAKTPLRTANQIRNGGLVWWRRGRIELPVQATDALSLLQAYPDSLISLRRTLRARPSGASQMVLSAPHRHQARSTPANRRSFPVRRGGTGMNVTA